MPENNNNNDQSSSNSPSTNYTAKEKIKANVPIANPGQINTQEPQSPENMAMMAQARASQTDSTQTLNNGKHTHVLGTYYSKAKGVDPNKIKNTANSSSEKTSTAKATNVATEKQVVDSENAQNVGEEKTTIPETPTTNAANSATTKATAEQKKKEEDKNSNDDPIVGAKAIEKYKLRSDVLHPNYKIGNVEEDKKILKETFKSEDKLTDDVGKGKKNNPSDVKIVAMKLQGHNITGIPKECLEKGEWKDELTAKIKAFQKGNMAIKPYVKSKAYKNPDGIVSPKGATFNALNNCSGLDAIYMNRSTVNSKIEKKNTKLTANVGVDWGKHKAVNKKEDVILVAELLVENGITDIPDSVLIEGKADEAFGEKIKEYQKKVGSTVAGIVIPDKSTIKNLTQKREKNANLGVMGYDMEKGTHNSTEERATYEEKLDSMNDNLSIADGSNFDLIIKMANKAAIDSKYFKEITKDVSAELIINDIHRKDEGVTLSAVLEDRIKRFHKFLVAAGLYSGSMSVSDGARSPQRAHRWCVEWLIESSSAKKYRTKVMANLVKMYNDNSFHDGEFIKDRDGNHWAKKEHFYKDFINIDREFKTKAAKEEHDKIPRLEPKGKKEVRVFWDDVVKFVKEETIAKRKEDSRSFRSKSNAPASEGYSDADKRMPSPAGSRPSLTNHKTGEAIDINSNPFTIKSDAILDLIGLRFGVIRDGGSSEYWHYEMTGVEIQKDKNDENKK